MDKHYERIERAREYVRTQGLYGFADHTSVPQWMAAFAESETAQLRAENERLRAEVDKGVKEIEQYSKESQKLATKHGKLYGNALAELSESKRRIAELEDAIRWALGETDFGERKEGEGPYWWRIKLREKANLKTK